jgi:hypothetical protein
MKNRSGVTSGVTRTIDTWSFGCVLSVAATWAVLGHSGVRQYEKIRQLSPGNNKDDRVYDRFHDGVLVLPQVLEWHNYLRDHVRSSDMVTSLVLDLVEERMLRGNSIDRIDSTELCAELKRLVSRAAKKVEAFQTVFDTSDQSSTQAESVSAGTTLVASQEELSIDVTKSPFIGDDDYMSVASNQEDIASRAAGFRTQPEIFAVREFGSFFGDLTELRSLHRAALEKLGIERFQINYRRILKNYTLELMTHADSAIERDTVAVLKRRSNRVSIVQKIISSLHGDGEANSKAFEELRSVGFETHRSVLEGWARNVYGRPDDDMGHHEQQAGEGDSKDDEESDDGDEAAIFKDLQFPNISLATQFMLTRKAFQVLIVELRLLTLPATVREVLESTQKSAIQISSENDTSLLNRAKAYIEDNTSYEWDWWPLKPRLPDLTSDNWRIQWKVRKSVAQTDNMLEFAD